MRMTAEDACKLLDVTANASFEEVVVAKNRKIAAADGDADKVIEIEAAYDILFMRSMKRRMTGELEVSTTVRYADVPPAPPRRGPAASASKSGSSSKTAPAAKLPVGGLTVESPRNQQVALVQAGVFAGVAAWALAQALLEPPELQMSDTAGLQMAVALGYGIYSLKENKKMDLGRAAGISIGCLFAGALLGTGLQNWLRVDIVPLGNFASPGVFVTEVIITVLAAGVIFLA